jgi:hypothetical protein
MFALFLTGCSTTSVPLSKSPEKLRDWMLVRTPLGCTSDQVYVFIKQQQWEIEEEIRKDGTLRQFPGHAENLKIVGSYIKCDLGTTDLVYFPFQTDVLASWAFDNDNRLIDVWIEQQTDAPK